LGLIKEERYNNFIEKNRLIEQEKARLKKITIKPEEHVQQIITDSNATPIKEAVKAIDLLKRPQLSYEAIEQMIEPDASLLTEVKEQVKIQIKNEGSIKKTIEPDDSLPSEGKEQVTSQIKYERYIKKANEQVDRMLKMEDKKIPEDIDYEDVSGIATEAKERLKKVRPLSVGQASRIAGVNPADVSILAIYIEQGKIARVAN